MKSKACVCTLLLGSDSDSEISLGLMNQCGELTYKSGKILRAEEVIGQAKEVVESYFRSLPKTHSKTHIRKAQTILLPCSPWTADPDDSSVAPYFGTDPLTPIPSPLSRAVKAGGLSRTFLMFLFVVFRSLTSAGASRLTYINHEVKIMAKSLELTFNLDDGRTMQISIPYAKENLTLDQVKEKAAKIMPVLESQNGASATSLKQAKITETTSTVLE